MRRVIISLTLLATFAVATPANASYYLTKRQAEHYARVYWHNARNYYSVGTSCRPQGHQKAQRGYIYHRWTCGFAAASDASSVPYDCDGLMVVAGSHAAYTYFSRIQWKRGDCPDVQSTDDTPADPAPVVPTYPTYPVIPAPANPAPGPTYPVVCADGTISQSGGHPGACSWHGGIG